MSEENTSVGRVRVRSNVVQDENAWHLVPGDALYAHRPDLLRAPNRPTARQRDEYLYYVPCSVCQRASHRMFLEGCSQCPYGPSAAEVASARAAHERALKAVARIELLTPRCRMTAAIGQRVKHRATAELGVVQMSLRAGTRPRYRVAFPSGTVDAVWRLRSHLRRPICCSRTSDGLAVPWWLRREAQG